MSNYHKPIYWRFYRVVLYGSPRWPSWCEWIVDGRPFDPNDQGLGHGVLHKPMEEAPNDQTSVGLLRRLCA